MEILRRNKGVSTYIEVVPDARGPVNMADPSGHYPEEMLKNNTLGTLLPLQLQWVDGSAHLLYKTDGMISLSRIWSSKGPGRAEVQRLLLDLAAAIRELEDYLLPPEGLILSLSYIMHDENSDRLRFLYVTEGGAEFSSGMKRMFEEIMPAYLHEGESDILWLYDMYGRFLDGSFTPDMLLQLTDEWRQERRPEQWQEGWPGRRQERGLEGRQERGQEERKERWQEGRPGRGQEGNAEPAAFVDAGMAGPKEEKPSLLQSGRVLILIGVAVLLTAMGLFVLMGSRSLMISAVLAAAYAVFLVCQLLSEDQRKKAVSRKEMEDRLREPYKEPDGVVAYVEEAVHYAQATEGGGSETGVLAPALKQLVPMEVGMRAPLYISEGYCRIGRTAGENEYCIPAPAISRNHARLECSGNVVTLQDLGSTNGTYLNHVRLGRENVAELHYGDVVSFAGEEFYVV